MPVSTVNISFNTEFLAQLDQIANAEARTRSELIREAARIYIERKKEWQKLFEIGNQIGKTLEISQENLMDEIKEHRRAKKKNK